MIKKTVYFRTQADLDKFNAIPNKAKWLQEKLNEGREFYDRFKAELFTVKTADPSIQLLEGSTVLEAAARAAGIEATAESAKP